MAGDPRAPAAILALLLAIPFAVSAQTAEKKEPAKGDLGCRDDSEVEQPALETVREGIQRSVCNTARFVDRMFGGEHEYSEMEDDSNGRAGLALGWNEQDGFDADARFRASVTLPALSERFSATLGRASRDEFVSDELNGVGSFGASFSDDEPADWFAGLGYRMHRGRDSRFDLGAGMQLQSPLNPYVNARYRKYFYRPDNVLLTLRSTAFWENDEGFGLTQAFDADKVLGRDYLLRWGNSLRVSEATEGVRWRTRLALYQAIDYRRAMRYDVRIRGETDGTEPDLYGFRVTHRRSMWRDWLFVEMGTGFFWADGPEPADRCHGCVDARLGFEILFGQAYDRVLRREERRTEAEEKRNASD
jgi:hypothetical protein